MIFHQLPIARLVFYWFALNAFKWLKPYCWNNCKCKGEGGGEGEGAVHGVIVII